MKQIAKAIIEVMKTVKGVGKNTTVGIGKNSYKGVDDKDVKEVYSKAMIDNGLCILPLEVKENSLIVNRWEEMTWDYKANKMVNKWKQSVVCSITTKYLLLHESGESQELGGYGHGVDAQDKGAGKASTYALKYALLYLFMAQKGDIDDTDATHSQDIDTPQKTKKPYPTKKYEQAAKSIYESKCTFQDIEKIYTLSEAAKEVIMGYVTNLDQ